MEQKYINSKNTNNEIVIKKSRFITHIKRTVSEEEAKDFIDEIKKEHKAANHNCSAYIIGKSALIQKADDDGEPQGMAGVPILEVLKKEELYNVTVVVTRYFGGIKLGGGGLIRAYSQSASAAVEAAGKVIEVPVVPLTVSLDYTFTSKFEHFLGNTEASIVSTDYTDKVTYLIHVKEKGADDIVNTLKEITSNSFEYEAGDIITALETV
ncbi:IMPACT family member YigZ [Jeotgalicoccus aerolatus]|uniref:YigZ family protein n=1 Tax=Jeotgalicoccus aerolatus TaxID=709510 RepID=A0ABS4HJP7_9STAP|nr:YigZ family protein [Jeotgalicoccus aerolatus]MBP1951145.1 putative YigZ family protein [Jeotgalicoccus aerolatus]GGD99915.1 YigZ family protein [Jeotgalicoccus aerolatus]CAD2077891.1 IMPACT family member YigZ [Jeotgalicoccus aerolatus]